MSTRTMDLLIVCMYYTSKTSEEKGKSNYSHAVKILNELHDEETNKAPNRIPPVVGLYFNDGMAHDAHGKKFNLLAPWREGMAVKLFRALLEQIPLTQLTPGASVSPHTWDKPGDPARSTSSW